MNKARPFARSNAALVAAILLLLVVPAPRASVTEALLCACCAEPGEWFERTGRLESYEVSELSNVKFDAVAKLYTTAAGFEGTKGLPAQYESFQLSDSLGRALRWTLTLKGEHS